METTEKPRRKPGLTCPMHNKDVSRVCHTCELYVHLRGKNPQSEQEFDHWGCAWAFMPLLLVENTQMQRQTGAAVESFRNESVRSSRGLAEALTTAIAVSARVAASPSMPLLTAEENAPN